MPTMKTWREICATYFRTRIRCGTPRRILRTVSPPATKAGSAAPWRPTAGRWAVSAFFVGADVYSKSAELGYWLAEEYWGRGMMTQAVREICAEAFRRFGLARIYAEPFCAQYRLPPRSGKGRLCARGRDAQGRIQARRGAGLLHVRAGSGRCARRRRGFIRPYDSRRVFPPRQNILCRIDFEGRFAIIKRVSIS